MPQNIKLFYDTFYAEQDDGKIYSKIINSIEETEYPTPILSSLIERCQNSDKTEIQKEWSLWVGNQLNEVASVNPYSEYVEVGEEITPTDAVAWVDGTRNVDCRPKVFDGVTKTWKLCDSGSMVTVIKKGPNDIIDKTRVLQAVNGSSRGNTTWPKNIPSRCHHCRRQSRHPWMGLHVKA